LSVQIQTTASPEQLEQIVGSGEPVERLAFLGQEPAPQGQEEKRSKWELRMTAQFLEYFKACVKGKSVAMIATMIKNNCSC
jgi:hypothetical protein